MPLPAQRRNANESPAEGNRTAPYCESGPQQLLRQRLQFRTVLAGLLAAAVKDGLELRECLVEVAVDDHVVEVPPARHLEDRFVDPARDRLFAVAAALAQPRLELGARGRQDEDLDRLRQPLADLRRPLPVDLEDQVAALGERGLDDAAARSVEVAEDVRVLDEFVRIPQALEIRALDEVVVLAVVLAGAGLARRAGDGERHRRAPAHQRPQEARLAGARGRRDDVETAALRHVSDSGGSASRPAWGRPRPRRAATGAGRAPSAARHTTPGTRTST